MLQIAVALYPLGVYTGRMIQGIKKRATHRSKIIVGQFNGLIKAIENEEYCLDILTQSLAIQQSLKSLNKLVLENHLRTHVKDGMKTNNESDHEKLIEELMELYELSKVRSK